MLILASESPRRREILEAAGIEFVARAGKVAEELGDGETADAYVRRLAEAKARAAEAGADDVVLGADTVVVVEGEILEKPRDGEDACRMLRALSGREHEVVTGICLLGRGRMVVDCARTRVRFAALSDAEIAEYAASGEPLDKAGAYAIQGRASKFIERIEGDYFNVVGLPVALVYARLREMAR